MKRQGTCQVSKGRAGNGSHSANLSADSSSALSAGFTLLEMLVVLGLLGIVLTALTNYFIQTARTSVQSSARAEMQQDSLNAQQLVTARLREAWYVYPAGMSFTLNAADATTQNPITGGSSWTTGQHPILAMILPPTERTLNCATSSDGCYRFYAYYPVRRSVWLGAVTTTPWKDPGADSVNGDVWVLAEYRAFMPASFNPAPNTFPPAAPPAVPGGASGNILTDYLAPSVVTAPYTTSTNAYTMFTYTMSAGAPSYVTGVTFNLANTRQVQGTVMRLPDATENYKNSVFPTNLGRV